MISVCLATYNGEKYIKTQIDSIISQLSEEDELIVSDDGSNDNTLEIINSFNDKRIRILNHVSDKTYSGHEKATANFENALKEAKGDYIFLSDQDDIWQGNKVKLCLELLNKYDFVVHNMSIIDNDGNLIKKSRYEHNPLPNSYLKLIFHMNLWGCCMCFNRDVLQKCLPFPKKLIAHDYWISTISIKHFKCYYEENPLIQYREHVDSVSYKKKTTLIYKISYRLKLFIQLIGR